ncbi:hypothetical protein [Massilia haematophila]|uniref:Uncharacterized protein n=1 Tax=Massilia haematophila TaxID=457923 RepID=A0ABV7PBX8_9BURK
MLRKAGRIIEAWRKGEPAALDALLAEATAGGTTIADFTRRKLLGGATRTWPPTSTT